MRLSVILIVIGSQETVVEGFERGLKEIKSEDESRLSKLQQCEDRPEYSKELRMSKENFCHSNLIE